MDTVLHSIGISTLHKWEREEIFLDHIILTWRVIQEVKVVIPFSRHNAIKQNSGQLLRSFIFIVYYVHKAKCWTPFKLKTVMVMNIMENLRKIRILWLTIIFALSYLQYSSCWWVFATGICTEDQETSIVRPKSIHSTPTVQNTVDQ